MSELGAVLLLLSIWAVLNFVLPRFGIHTGG
jgi:hypothetical protein